MARVSIPSHWFNRIVCSGFDSDRVLGFSVNLGGRASKEERRWLKSHGYVFSGGAWIRADRKQTRMSYDAMKAHRRLVAARRKRATNLDNTAHVLGR